jgi:hypothetical protein
MKDEKHYGSFAELAKAMGFKPVRKVTKDKEKLATQRDKFMARHKCRGCGSPMVWVPGTNIMTCTNDNCRGVKITRAGKDDSDEVKTFYETSYDVLDDLGAVIAENIFD